MQDFIHQQYYTTITGCGVLLKSVRNSARWGSGIGALGSKGGPRDFRIKLHLRLRRPRRRKAGLNTAAHLKPSNRNDMSSGAVPVVKGLCLGMFGSFLFEGPGRGLMTDGYEKLQPLFSNRLA